MRTVTPQELHDALQKGAGARLIDVRTPVEFRAAHIDSAELNPLDQLDPKACDVKAEETIYLICESGARSAKAYEKFISAGIENAAVVDGGNRAWIEAGLPVIRGKKAMSLERQVRIAAGAFVLLGAVLGWLVHPGFYGLSAFVGAGLIFAGITDTCGMAMLLAKAPWNRVDYPMGAKTCSIQK